MKLIYIVLLLSFNLFAAETIPKSEKPKVMLKSISEHAICIGTGDTKVVYMFVDPMCKFSKRIITLVSKNKMLQLANTYYIFLYRLPKLDSDKLIQFIYQSQEQESALLDVMVDNDMIDLDDFKVSDKTIKSIKAISKVAKKLDIKIRPYMISFEKDSKFCVVSEGEAPCLEAFED